MRSHHNSKLNFSHAPYEKNLHLNNVDREIRMGELRLKYVQLMRDAHSFLGDEDANILIKESKDIWDKLSNLKGLEV
ncbi:hypothetical protein [Prochlorococcus marinus]|uniref:Uncharacterized protein n=1 Tax=Prochlorococcus marinus str. PAC1 TaxID=59924 RepID=A0A0A2C3W0_PROMR|nr:hypothetical protein [Prochlorococcus marinus]KGG20222.1 hypothetical protein EV03_1427 [Prochlorococcus marinus str. PAC1]